MEKTGNVQLTLSNISQPLKVWEKLEIVVGEDDERGIYLSRIEDFIAGGILITAPEFQQGSTLLRENCDVTVMVTKTDAVYQFSSKIRRFNSQAKSLYILTPPRHIKRVQRRQFVRIDFVEKISIAPIKPDSADGELKWSEASCRNLSGGGMLVHSDVEVPKGAMLLIKARVFEVLSIPVPVAAVCRRVQRDDRDYLYGIEFLRQDNIEVFLNKKSVAALPLSIFGFDRAAQNKLVNHIFQQQIQMRRKGVL